MSKKVELELTENQQWLRMADIRLRGLRFDPTNHEFHRITAARQEIFGRLTDDEKESYKSVAASLRR